MRNKHKKKLRAYLGTIMSEVVENYASDSHMREDLAEVMVAGELERLALEMRGRAAHRTFRFWRKLNG